MSKPKMLLNACCAPCAIAALSAFHNEYEITIFFYGNNFDSAPEFNRRLDALTVANRELNYGRKMVVIPYQPHYFLSAVRDREKDCEGGSRCKICYRLRLRAAAEHAKLNGFDCFSTSLTLSPHKSTQIINQIGREVGDQFGVPFIEADLKSNNGFLLTVAESKRLNIYRQKYCGCRFSLRGNVCQE